MAGILAYGAYLPRHRLQRGAITAPGGQPGRGRGTRTVAAYDEDTTTMGVEAARLALQAAPEGAAATALYFATAAPAYLDKTNATALHAALRLPVEAAAIDMVGPVRTAAGALRAALHAPAPTMAVLADVRTGLPGSGEERDSGDAAAAVLATSGDGPVVAEYLAGASASGEYLDRWRLPGQAFAHQWNETFGEEVGTPLGEQALSDALKAAGIAADALDHLLVTGNNARTVRHVIKESGARPEVVADDLSAVVGNTGTAHPGLLLASVLDRAQPGETIALVVVSDGAEAFVFRATDELARRRPVLPVAVQLEAGGDDLPYTKFLAWRGVLPVEGPRKAPPRGPQAPASWRVDDFKYGLAASRCRRCGTRQLPPQRVCHSCHAVDEMDRESVADLRGTVATFTVDRLAWSPSPPAVFAVVDVDGGGRVQCDLTEVAPDAVAKGMRVAMAFRRLYTQDDVHNYLWKARPLRPGEED